MMKSTTPMIALLALAGAWAPLALARDACLVGTWSPVGNGAAEWVQRQAPGMKMMIQQQAATMQLRGDGSYQMDSQIQAQASQAGMGARSQGRFSASGQWSSAGAELTLVPAKTDMDASLSMSSGKRSMPAIRLPKGEAKPTVHEYRCSGAELETRMRIPGSADPIVQRYRRQ